MTKHLLDQTCLTANDSTETDGLRLLIMGHLPCLHSEDILEKDTPSLDALLAAVGGSQICLIPSMAFKEAHPSKLRLKILMNNH